VVRGPSVEHPQGTLEAGFDQLIRQHLRFFSEMPPREEADKTADPRDLQFRELLEALPVAIYTTDAQGRITYFNQAAADFWGHRPTLGSSEWCGSWKLFWSDGRPLPHDECPMAVALKEGRAVRGQEAVAMRPDGTCVPFIPYPTPLHDTSGKLVGAMNMLVDITERKRAEERQALLIRELHHRVKNTLATVQAIMGSTARASSTMEEFQQSFIGRIAALSKTHSLLIEHPSQLVSLRSLLRNELEIFEDGSSQRVRVEGPDVELGSEIAVPIGTAIHELTNNAAKHGALSLLGGSIEVVWTVEPDTHELVLEWTERDGPPVIEPTKHGFGTRLLEHVLTSQISADVTMDHAPEGVRARIAVPLPIR
jgi:PAS domain S-box-containing protein